MCKFLILAFWVCLVLPRYAESAEAVSGYEITKVNHELINEKGFTHESIADFVAKAQYQQELAASKSASGLRFIVHWRVPSSRISNFVVKVQARGLDANTQREIEESVTKIYPQTPSSTGWAFLDIEGESAKRLGKLMAWKVTLFQNNNPVATRKSLMWDDSFHPKN